MGITIFPVRKSTIRMKLLPFVAGYAAAACGDDERLVNGVCTKKCDLFTVSCDVNDGFTLKADLACRDQQYSHLTFDNDNFFVNADSLSDGSDLDAAAECKFSNGVISNLSYKSCNGFKYTEGDSFNTYTGYINQRVKVGNTVSSFLDEIKFECNLEHVDLDTDNENNKAVVGLSANDEKTSTGTVASQELIEKLGLKLQVGEVEDYDASQWKKEITDQKIDVGSTVQVRLDSAANSPFAFALRECAALSNAQEVELYDEFCKNAASGVVALSQQSHVAYNLNVFRIGNDSKLTFKCKVSLFPLDADLPVCPDLPAGRKRRETTNVAFYERHARSVEREGEVVFSINLKDDGTSGAAETCANFIIPSVFFYTLY